MEQSEQLTVSGCAKDQCCTSRVRKKETQATECPPDMFVTKVGCTGCNCRKVLFTCTRFEGVTATGCFWTAETFSEEQEKTLFEPDQAITGIECSGSNCDNKRFRICTVTGN